MSFHFISYNIFIALTGLLILSSANANTTAVYQITESPGNYLQTTLTHDIYRYSANSRLQDVVVLDEQGNRLPFRIIPLATQIQEARSQVPVTFFPVAVGAAPETWLSGKTQIRIDQNAISINIDKNAPDESTSQLPAVDFYLLDLGDVSTRIDSFAFEWQTSEVDHYLDVEISGTRDLRTWTNLAHGTLVHLQKDGQTLRRNQIPIGVENNQYTYLRVKFLRGGEQLSLSRIFAQSKTNTAKPIAADTWQVDGSRAQDQSSVLRINNNTKALPVAAWEYQRDERAPVTKFQLALGDTTYGNNINVFSRAAEKQPWRLVHRGTWFNARIGNDWQQSDAIKIYANSDVYWRVELSPDVSERVNPALIFEHRPQVLQFIANNAAPYRIAIERNAETDNTSARIFTQLTEGKNPDWAQVSFTELKPDTKNFATVSGINWQTTLFWGMLLMAVAVLIGFSVRLYRHMG